MRGLLQKEIKLNKEQIKDFVVKNKRIVAISGAGMAVVIIALVIFMTMNSEKNTAEDNNPAAPKQTVYSYLPENTRVTGERAEVRDPFTGALSLKGVITGGEEDNVAIIEAGNIAYVARKDTVIAGSWTVYDIKSDAVYLKSGDRKLRLDFNGRVKNIDTKPVVNTGGNGTGQKEPGAATSEQKSSNAVSGNTASASDSGQVADTGEGSWINIAKNQSTTGESGGGE